LRAQVYNGYKYYFVEKLHQRTTFAQHKYKCTSCVEKATNAKESVDIRKMLWNFLTERKIQEYVEGFENIGFPQGFGAMLMQ